MNRTIFRSILLGTLVTIGCGEPYTPPEMTEEERAMAAEYAAYSEDLQRAMAESGDYVQVAVIDRETTFPDDDQTYARVLVLMREELDLDDYGLSLPGKEAEEDWVPGFFNEVLFWTDAKGDIVFDDYGRPPGREMVVEWCVANNVPEGRVSLHFGGNPCLVIDLNRE